MDRMTITEALAEIKTIKARMAKKRESVARYLMRDCRLRDPMEADGGSAKFVERERQAIGDLEQRIIAIRCAIQTVNLATSFTVQGTARTMAAWLTWRREVAPEAKGFLSQLVSHVGEMRQKAEQKGVRMTDKDSGTAVPEIVVAVNEQQLAKEVEQMEATLGELDGKLSLLNATTVVEF